MDDSGQAVESEVAKFCNALCEQRDQGFGFVPLLGAGLSAPSGVPVTTEIESYLRKCIVAALGLHTRSDRDGKCGARPRRWQPWRDEWPAFSEFRLTDESISPEDSNEWLMRAIAKSKDRSNEEASVFQEAVGAMAEWRSALHFISRLRSTGDDDGEAIDSNAPLRLAEPDLDLSDTFFLSLVSGKKPSLGHLAIALLADLLRFETVLTTNFDDLLERAFRQIGMPVNSFDVHLQTGLPQYAHIRGERAVIKVHGGRYGLRADYSLDAEPLHKDKLRFTSYFAGRHLTSRDFEREEKGAWKPIAPRRHLFVAGISGTEVRVKELVKSAFRQLDENFHVFWVCHSSRDIENAIRFKESVLRKGDDSNRFWILHHRYLGLLFLQLYQQLTHGLPPSATLFPASPRIPVPAEPNQYVDPEEPDSADSDADTRTDTPRSIKGRGIAKEFRERLRECIDRVKGRGERKFDRLVMATSLGVVHGISSVVAEEFDTRRDSGTKCLWLDLDDVSSTDDLWEQLFDAVLLEVGYTDWKPVLRNPDGKQCAEELERVTKTSYQDWVIYLNARDGAGSAFERTAAEPYSAESNGWISNRSSLPNRGTAESAGQNAANTDEDDSANLDSFLRLMSELTGTACRRFTFVFLCHNSEEVCTEIQNQRASEGDRGGSKTSREWRKTNCELLKKSCVSEFKKENSAASAGIDWIKESESVGTSGQRYRFLAALVLANRSRYPAMLLSWAFHSRHEVRSLSERQLKENGPEQAELDMQQRFQWMTEWIDELDDLGVVRRKPGGFIWLQSPIRNELRSRMRERDADEWHSVATEVHHGLAEWYRKLFLSSRSPLAICEMVNHRLEESIAALERIRSDDEQRTQSRLIRAERALNDAVRILDVGRKPMLSGGYTRNTCRRLSELRRRIREIRDELLSRIKRTASVTETKLLHELKRLLDRLFDASFRLNSEIAQETGESEIAVLRLAEAQHAIMTRDRNGKKKATRKKTGFDMPRLWQLPQEPRRSAPQADRCDYFQMLGTLLIANRCYKAAEKQLDRVYQCVNFPYVKLVTRKVNAADNVKQVLDWFRDHGRSDETAADNEGHYEQFDPAMRVITTLQRNMQLFLLKGQATHLGSRREKDRRERKKLRKQSEEHYELARQCYRIAIEILLALPADSASQHQYFDERQKLETQHGLAWSFLRDFRKAHRRLDEAESCLERAGLDYRSLEFAVIELHRAEILTQQAVFKEGPGDVNAMTTLGVYRENLREIWSSDEDCNDAILRTRRPRGTVSREMERCQAYLDDALNALTRAFSALELQRKNVWWTTWYFELKLKVIELQLFASISGETLPYLDVSVAPEGAKTEVDRLLTNSIRMVRMDVFRLARIIEAYSHCLFALTAWVVKKTPADFQVVGIVDSVATSAKGRDEHLELRESMRKRYADMRKELSDAAWTLIERTCDRNNSTATAELRALREKHPTMRFEYETVDEESSEHRELIDRCFTPAKSSRKSVKAFSVSEDVIEYVKQVCRTVNSVLRYQPRAFRQGRDARSGDE